MVQWRYASGGLISCVEKLKLLNENMQEIDQVLNAALDDAVIIGIDSKEYKEILKQFIDSLESDYK